MTRVFALNMHAEWACKHSGACCRAGWPIPVEPEVRAAVGAAWLLPGDDGCCPQFDAATALCRVHRDYGEASLPASCHHFPRRALIDARGTFVTLSHFCPTAAALLVDADRPLEVVIDPPRFPAARGYEGLDARDDWPPLVRANLLFDPDSFAVWQHYVLSTLGSSLDDVPTTLGRLAASAERVRNWSVDQGPLVAWVTQQVQRPLDDDGSARARYARVAGRDAYTRACDTVLAGLQRPDSSATPAVPLDEAVWRQQAPAVLRYLAATAFASWTAYQSRGLRTQVAELYMAAAVLRVECERACSRSRAALDRQSLIDAIRASDRLLVHLADRTALTAWLGEVE